MSSQEVEIPEIESPLLVDYARSLRTAATGWPPAGVTRTRLLLIATKLEALAKQNPRARLIDLVTQGFD